MERSMYLINPIVIGLKVIISHGDVRSMLDNIANMLHVGGGLLDTSRTIILFYTTIMHSNLATVLGQDASAVYRGERCAR